MSTELSRATQIDRLSTLPPELVSTIFDLAHDPGQPLREPLSKTLLPYFRRNLYREIKLKSASSIPQLLSTLQRLPSLASLVFELNTYTVDPESSASEPLKILLEHLPHLQSLEIDEVVKLSWTFTAPLCLRLTTLVSLCYGCHRLHEADTKLLSLFPSLRRVEISYDDFRADVPSSSPTSVPKIKDLSLIHYCHAGYGNSMLSTPEMARFINQFPQLSRIKLYDYDPTRYGRLLTHLSHAPSSLTHLALQTACAEEQPWSSYDYTLPRFSKLERLELSLAALPDSFSARLRQLPHLSTLCLDTLTSPSLNHPGPVFTVKDLISLVEGPGRIETLKFLEIDSVRGKMGERVDFEDLSELSSTRLSMGFPWSKPDFGDWSISELERLREIGRLNGVEVGGSTYEAIPIKSAYFLEEANRVILEVYWEKSFTPYEMLRATGRNDRLPILDIDQLDSENLKLVKIDLPEEDWYQFTLE
ncbi:hypothetical protein JCM3765_001861 [Sporobolomyces pararoseus]